ncbi:TolC family outer membrane protein [Microbulbifer sp. OS29]|uniref:TolC family outer membrane protein n=1 Tax=Microbulbifer okhotskensis TaxID=2926617 RepID=A0A9X2EPN5_9GAMM|nr:TolC family outer membrane protein [Microbulbifer okhotskensis]MCO1336142.1 TolC family outer membrane protein [Microbulbifer okhotskensis]
MEVFKRLWKMPFLFVLVFWTFFAEADLFGAPPSAEVISPRNVDVEAKDLLKQLSFREYEEGIKRNELNMLELVHQAVGWHPLIAEVIGNLYQQRQGVRAAKSGYFPQLSAGVVAGHDSEYKREGDGHAFQVNISQMVYDFGKVSSNVDSAKAGVQRSQAEVLQSIDEVARRAAKAAIEVQRYQSLLITSDAQVQGVSAIAQLVQIRKDRGVSARSEVLQAQSRVDAAQASKQQVEALLRRWRSTLQKLTGFQSPFRVAMYVPEDVAQACDVESFDLSSVPDVLVAEADRAEAEAKLKSSKANTWPTFTLDGNINQYLDQNYVDANALSKNEKAIFFNVSMPIYQGGKISAGREGANYALMSADAARDNALLSVTQKYREAQEEAEGLMRSLGALSARESAIAETRDLYKQQYSTLGTRTLIDLLNSEQELHFARLEKNNTIFDLHLLKIDCLHSRGGLREAFKLDGTEIQGVEVLP